MSPDKWLEIKLNIAKHFTVEEQGNEDLLVDTAEGQVKQGEAEFVVFQSPLGRTKLQFQKKPKLEDKQYHYSHQQGQSARVEYKFSTNEFVYTFKAYKWDEIEDEWREIEPSAFGD